MNFKIGQKFLFVRKGFVNPLCKLPVDNTIVLIKSKCTDYPDSYNLVDFEYSECGLPQSFHKEHLKPLDYDFVEEVLSMIKEKSLVNTDNLKQLV